MQPRAPNGANEAVGLNRSMRAQGAANRRYNVRRTASRQKFCARRGTKGLQALLPVEQYAACACAYGEDPKSPARTARGKRGLLYKTGIHRK